MKKLSQHIYYSIIAITTLAIFALGEKLTYAQSADEFLFDLPEESITLPNISEGNGIIDVLIFIQNVLLKLLLPLVAIGSALYIAYELFTAEGDETKMKQAWTAVTYSIIALIAIMLSALVVNLISKLNIG